MVLAEVVGAILGVVAGLIPGLHSNTLISILYSMGVPTDDLPLIIITLFGSYSLSSFIPSIFLGIPDDSSILAVLPGQRMVKEGRGILALKIVLFSAVISALLSVALFPLSLALFPVIYSAISPYMEYILIFASFLLLIRNRNPGWALAIFLISGVLGYFSFNAGMGDPFLPLFSGMFAGAAVLTYRHGKIPEQKEEKLETGGIWKYIIAGVAGGLVADVLPGISSASQMAVFISFILPVTSIGYLATISSVSISEAVFALSTSASIGKARVGAVAWLDKVSPVEDSLMLYLALFLLSIAFTAGLLYLMRHAVTRIAKLNFGDIGKIIGAYLVIIVYLIDGWTGLLVFGLSTVAGLVCLRLEVNRTMLMGAIIIPTIILLASY